MKRSVVYIVILMAFSVGAGIVLGLGIGRHVGYTRHLMFEKRSGQQLSREESRQHALAVLNRSLGLSQDQTEKIGNILDSSRAKAETVKKETFKEMETLKENINTGIKALLTPDQQIKFDRLMAERKQREGLECSPQGVGPFPPPEP